MVPETGDMTAAEHMVTQCPESECGHRHRLKPHHVGKIANCKGCGRRFVLTPGLGSPVPGAASSLHGSAEPTENATESDERSTEHDSTSTVHSLRSPCASCNTILDATPNQRGKVIRCTSCNGRSRVPSSDGWREDHDWAPVWDWASTKRTAAEDANTKIGDELKIVFSWTQADEHPDFLLHELAKKTGLPRSLIAPWVLGYIEGLTGVGRKAIASLVLGVCGLFAWLFPIVGFPVTIVGGILGIQRLTSISRRKAIAGVVLCAIGLLLTINNIITNADHGNSSSPVAPTPSRGSRQARASPPLARVRFERHDAIRLAEAHKDRIVEKHYDGGWDIEASVKEFFYDPVEHSRRVRVELRWTGVMTGAWDLFSKENVAKSHVARGWLDVGGGSWKWEHQYASKALSQWLALKDVVKAVVDSTSGYGFRFKNNCNHPVRLAIHYRDVNKVWRTAGWWNFTPGESGRLNFGGKTLKTKTAVWYYFAETTDDGNLVWRGSHTFKLNGRSLQMHKMKDTDGESNWNITCN